MPPELPHEDQDEAQFPDDPWITPYVFLGAVKVSIVLLMTDCGGDLLEKLLWGQ